MLTPSTASAPSAFDSSPTPAATPRYADAGIVVTEIATPTAELALVSSARIPATPAAKATIGVEMLTVERPARNSLSPDKSFVGPRCNWWSANVMTPPTRQAQPSPMRSVANARPARFQRRRTRAVAVAQMAQHIGADRHRAGPIDSSRSSATSSGGPTPTFDGFDDPVDGLVNQVCGHKRLTSRAVAAHDHVTCAVDSIELVGDVSDELRGTEHAQLQHDQVIHGRL